MARRFLTEEFSFGGNFSKKYGILLEPNRLIWYSTMLELLKRKVFNLATWRTSNGAINFLRQHFPGRLGFPRGGILWLQGV